MTAGWWHRDPHGQLWVLCTPTLTGAPSWHRAPVPPAEEPGPLPDRAPEPSRITAALDARGLYGPEVDEALDVHNAFDTTVDAWEAGEIVPTSGEVRRLATLTGHQPSWFFLGPVPQFDGPVFICKRGRTDV